ncbi:MAG: hypothetical protein IKY44_03080 [Clostridia bacterium]|nr:hypothetical protein [Clostridia bacterium]
MKFFRALICIMLVAIMLVGCRRISDPTMPIDPDATTTTTTAVNTTTGAITTTTNNGNANNTTTLPNGVTTTTTEEDTIPPTISQGSSPAPEMQKVSVYGLPVIVGDSRNRIKISAAGLLNGNAGNPMFIFVTNVGEDDIFSAKVTASVNGSTINFNISYLPRGGSVWAESVELYKYNENDKIVVNTDSVILTSTAANVPIDRGYDGILKIYAGEKDGGRGIFIENISGKKIKKVIVKYRPVASNGGLYAAPSQVIIENFEIDSKAFKANSYLFDVDIVDVQMTY